MDWLNYHHLMYFRTVAEEGSIAAASRKLHVSRSAVSMQIKSLEQALGSPLFERRGRHLSMTETGQLVLGYATEIHRSGRELLDAVRGAPSGRPQTLRVGIADVMPKMVAFQLLLPVMQGEDPPRLDCREDHPDRLFAELALHQLDLVLADVPLPPGLGIKAYHHLIADSSVSLFGSRALARRWGKDVPASLNQAPMLLPARTTAMRRVLDEWIDRSGLHFQVVGEFEDSALLKVFGQAGLGLFPAPTIVAAGVEERYRVKNMGELPEVRERFYAITPERKIKQPLVEKLVREAKEHFLTVS